MSEAFDPYHVWLGIPPEEQPPNHYRLLGLRPFEANADVISNALDQRRAFLRSAQGGKRAAQSQQLLNEVSAAGVALLDPAKKSQYDAELRRKLSPRPAAVAHSAATGLPDPMAPLAISDLLPQQRATAAPVSRGVSPVATLPPAAATPVILSPPLARGSAKRSSSSTTVVTAVIVSGAVLALVVIFVVAWRGMNASSPTEVTAAPAAAAAPASLPPSLPPPLPVDSKPDTGPGQAIGDGRPASSAITTRRESPAAAVAANVPRPGEPSATPPASSSPQTPSAPAGGSSASSKSPTFGGRQPVPDSQALSKAEEAARKLYANELKTATKPPQQVALGNVILVAGRATQNDLTDRFALVDLARTLFVQAGDVLEALTAARLLEIEYDIPRDQLLTSTIEALDDGSVIPEHRLMLARTAAELADTAIDAQDFERAEKLASIAVDSASKLRDADLRKSMVERRNHIQRLVKEWNTVKPSLERLKSEPSDPAANLVAGKFYCFSLEDFHQGLSYLAACGEVALSEAARLDLAAQVPDATKRYVAAQAWQKAELKIVDREDKLAAQRRERWLLQQAVAGLTGIEQIEANKRLAQLQNVGGPASGRSTGQMPAMPTKTKKKKTT